MRTRKPYSLYKRKICKKTIYYYSVFNEDGEVKRYSTGCTSQSNALDEIAHHTSFVRLRSGLASYRFRCCAEVRVRL